MKLGELDKLLEANYTIRMNNLPDMYEFLNRHLIKKLPDKYSISTVELVTKNIPNLSVNSGELCISRKFDWNTIKNLDVLKITDNLIVYVGYEYFH